ncbi:hypothetical protein [Streptococcus dysgalactiae]|uniref:hypothetical protein n=1 Tax=Streptococcus dysgalactiae TaxID=1334 RepID=UPI0010CAD2DE|nr:hypothetical protein [Streptococcus dysgalactiae]VTS16020.1 Uncharacterised protein [Streptococcus dysgalactiae subsp. equisimilis]
MMKVKEEFNGVGYFETLFSTLDMESMAGALKVFALKQDVKADSSSGEVLNGFVSSLIQSIDYQNFQELAPQFFNYPKQTNGTLEVTLIDDTKEFYQYLRTNIDTLLQEEIEVM